MGIFSSVANAFDSSAKAVGDAYKSSVAAKYIAKIVREQFDDQASGVDPDDGMGLLHAASAVACTLHSSADLLLEQAQADKHNQLTLAQVHSIIIETIRDKKLAIWEFDGNVNPIDLATIVLMAAPLKIKARSALLHAQMQKRPSDAAGFSAMFDVVEEDLIGAALEGIASGDNVKTMRTAQAAVWAVAELRQQKIEQMAGR